MRSQIKSCNMRQNDKFYLYLFEISIFLLLCWGCHAWFTWNLDFLDTKIRLIVLVIFGFIALTYKNHYNIQIIRKDLLVGGVVLFMVARCFPLQNLFALIESLLYGWCTIYPITILLSDRINAKRHLAFISNTLAIILSLGLPLWLYVSFVNVLPGLPIAYNGDNESYVFFNYGIMLKSIFWQHLDSIRFQSIFLEPGTLGQLCALMLYANKFDLSKNCNRILLLACICSFSLAGYIIAFLAYALITIQKRGMIKGIVIIPFMLFSIYYMGISYNGGNNEFNNRIIERLEFDDKKIISGNDRFHGDTDLVYSTLSENGGLLFGDSQASKKYNISGAGYKLFFIINGIFSAILYLFSHLLFVGVFKNKKYGLCFVVLLIAVFVQASHPASYASLVPFALGLSVFGKDDIFV